MEFVNILPLLEQVIPLSKDRGRNKYPFAFDHFLLKLNLIRFHSTALTQPYLIEVHEYTVHHKYIFKFPFCNGLAWMAMPLNGVKAFQPTSINVYKDREVYSIFMTIDWYFMTTMRYHAKCQINTQYVSKYGVMVFGYIPSALGCKLSKMCHTR